MIATVCCLGLALLGGSLALAGQDTTPVPSSSKLKWHTRGVPVKAEGAKAEASKSQASQNEGSKSDVTKTETSKAVSDSGSADPGLLSKAPPARPLKRRVPAPTSRSRLRDSIMQVGGSLAGDAPADDASTDLAPAAETLPEPNAEGAMP